MTDIIDEIEKRIADKTATLEDMYIWHQYAVECPRRDVCWYCGGKLCWGSDFNYDEVYGEGEGIYTELICTECGARVQYSRRDDEEDEE